MFQPRYTGNRSCISPKHRPLPLTHPYVSLLSKGDELMILEAMKMEHAIPAPANGTVDIAHFVEGDIVDEGAVLVTLRSPASEAP